jgi:dephospho-CoA kinase
MQKNEPRRPPWRIALTGGIGCGKTEVARQLQALGAAVWDADESVHRQLRRGTAAYRRIVRAFGPGVVRAGGSLCRVALAAAVFADARQRLALEKILHPAVIREMRAWLAQQRRDRRAAIAVVPLLFEVGLAHGWDAVVCVAADEGVALRRLRRRGVATADARRRMAAQWPLARKVQRSDAVIWNNGTRRQLAAQVKKFWACCPEEN